MMDDSRSDDDDDPDAEVEDPIAALIAQLHYDRADVARISAGAAVAMDLVIEQVQRAMDNPGADRARSLM